MISYDIYRQPSHHKILLDPFTPKYRGGKGLLVSDEVITGATKTSKEVLASYIANNERSGNDSPKIYAELQERQSTSYHQCRKRSCIAVGEYFRGRLAASHVKRNTLQIRIPLFGEQHWQRKRPTEVKTLWLNSDDPYGKSVGATRHYDDVHTYTDPYIRVIRIEDILSPYPKDASERMLIQLIGFSPDDLLITDAVASLNEKTYDLLTELAEAPETVSFVYDQLKRILKLLLRFKSESVKLVKEAASGKLIAELWLQYRYAIMPLIYSVNDVLEVLDNLEHKPQYLDERKRQHLEAESPFNPNATEFQTHRVFGKRYFDVYHGLKAELSINPFVTAWELVTLSLVVDWVINVGSVINALSTIDHDDEKITYSLKRECNYNDGDIAFDYTTYQRIIISNPTGHIKLGVDANMNAKRFADLLALCRVILFKK